MPELPAELGRPSVPPASARPRVWPPNLRGLPGFGAHERLTPREAAYQGRRYGIDALNPYLTIPSGFGEDVPVYGFLGGIDPAELREGRSQL